MEPILNRVAQSDLVVLDLAALGDGRGVDEFDLAPLLHRGLVLRERPFREALEAYDWAQHAGRHVAVHCSADAVVPTWAFMLVAAKLDGVAASVAHGRAGELVRDGYVRALEAADWSAYAGKPVVVKGCGTGGVPVDAYLLAVRKLQGVATKVMYGEPCSAVPIWRRPRPRPEGTAGPLPAASPAARPAGGARPAGPPRRPAGETGSAGDGP